MNSSPKAKTLFVTKYIENESLENNLRTIWTVNEDEKLISLFDNMKTDTFDWEVIAKEFEYKTATQCKIRWNQIKRPRPVKGPWTKEEDDLLFEWVKTTGPHHWSKCGQTLLSRSGKQCRERWFNCLSPEVVVGKWTPEEDYKIFQLYISRGSKWAKILDEFPGRTENSIKNRFYSILRQEATKKLRFESKKIALFKVKELLQYLPQVVEQLKKKIKKQCKYEDLSIWQTISFEVICNKANRQFSAGDAFGLNVLSKDGINNYSIVQNIASPNINCNFFFDPNKQLLNNRPYSIPFDFSTFQRMMYVFNPPMFDFKNPNTININKFN